LGIASKVQDTRRLKKVDRIRASEEEVKANPRSRSAWLRVAERLEKRRRMKQEIIEESSHKLAIKKAIVYGVLVVAVLISALWWCCKSLLIVMIFVI
jgi:hypothetical protein